MLQRFLSLFRSTAGRDEPAEAAATERYEGFELQARPRREGSLWRVAGRIRRPDDTEGPYHDFIRVDTTNSRDEAVQLSLTKARQIVDERGSATVPDAEDRDGKG